MRKKRRKLHIKEILICLILCAIPVALGFSHVQSFSYVDSLFEDYEEFLEFIIRDERSYKYSNFESISVSE